MSANRARTYRERLKAEGNEEKLEAYRQRRREANKRYREKQLSENAAEFRRKHRERNARCRRRKLEKLTPSITKENSGGFKSENDLQKAVEHVESKLPKDRNKAIEVIKFLAESIGLHLGNVAKESLDVEKGLAEVKLECQ